MELKTAIVTGASSGIGLAIAKMLSSEGYKVYGIGRIFPEDADFFEKRLSLDIRDTDILLKKISEIKKVDLLVNAAGSAYYGLAEFNTADQIKEMCRVDLEAPMILTSALLPKLKDTKGMVINIASVTSTRINTHGAAYGALKAGLRSYGRSLYEEVRKTGIFKALLSKEYKVLMRTSTYRMNCVFANLLWPAIAASLLISSRDNEIIGKIRSMLSSGDKKSIVIAFIVVAGISFIASGLNSIASTSFTREGVHIDLLKYLPAPLDKQIRAKGLIAIFFTYIPLGVSLIPVAVMFGVPHLILPMLIASLLCVITATAIGVAMDSISPYTVWSDELSALRGNLNCFFNLAAELIIAGLTGLISYGLFILTSSDVITITVSMVVLILMAATGVIRGFKIARKNIAES